MAPVAGSDRVGEVVATTPMSVVRLSKENLVMFIAHSRQVVNQIAGTPSRSLSETLRKSTRLITDDQAAVNPLRD
jgi:dsDNA-binding SOS-regulon protein